MCTSKRIIFHPALRNGHLCLGSFDGVQAGDHYHHGASAEAIWKRCRGVITHDNLDKFYMVDEQSGNTHPLCLEVACGKCEECIGQKTSALKNAIKLEMASTGLRPWFLTLTYRTECLPFDGVNKRHVQSFLKRLRSRLAYHFKDLGEFRTFYVSEYGSKYHRPHYHMLIFGIDPLRYMSYSTFHGIIADCWRYGFTHERQCDIGCAKYVSKYLYKGSNVPEGQNPNFRCGSIKNGGLGCGIVSHFDFLKQLLDNPEPIVKVMLFGSVVEVRVPTRIIKRAFGCTLDIAKHRYGKFVRDAYKYCMFLRQDPEIRYMVDLPSRSFFEKYEVFDIKSVKHERVPPGYFDLVPLHVKAKHLVILSRMLNKIKKINMCVQEWIQASYLCDKVMARVRQAAQVEHDISFYRTEFYKSKLDDERHPS